MTATKLQAGQNFQLFNSTGIKIIKHAHNPVDHILKLNQGGLYNKILQGTCQNNGAKTENLLAPLSLCLVSERKKVGHPLDRAASAPRVKQVM